MKAEIPRLSGADPLSEVVVDCCRHVYRRLGPGFSKNTYEEALCYELTLKRLSFQRRVTIPLFYRGARLSASSVVDLAVSGALVVDVRAVETLLAAHRVELKFRLRMTGVDTGLLVNFGAPRLSEGLVLIRRAERSPVDHPVEVVGLGAVRQEADLAVAS